MRWRRIIGGVVVGIGLAIALLLLTAWIGSSIPRNPDWRETPGGIEIMIENNGVHTAIVMPLVTPDKDWRADFPADDIAAPDKPYTHVAVSWGEREVFLNTPTWWDLSPLTVLRIAGIGGEGLIHAAHYVRPAPAPDLRPLRISRDDYRRLVAAIEASLPPRETRERHRGYGDWDVFYDAPGRYTWRRTCNQWTSDTLAAAGIRTGWWTPFAGGVMKWVPDLESRPQR